jgi:hypothetical protein
MNMPAKSARNKRRSIGLLTAAGYRWRDRQRIPDVKVL